MTPTAHGPGCSALELVNPLRPRPRILQELNWDVRLAEPGLARSGQSCAGQ